MPGTVTPNQLKKTPENFVLQTTFNYSDDSAQGLEKRFGINQDCTYDEFMQACDKVWATIRFTFGHQKFDELTGAKTVADKEANSET